LATFQSAPAVKPAAWSVRSLLPATGSPSVRVRPPTPAYLDVDDFEDPGRILFQASVGVAGGQLLEFNGPQRGGVTTKSVVIPVTGWDLQVRVGQDVAGYWIKR
jgi:hypothetical protein